MLKKIITLIVALGAIITASAASIYKENVAINKFAELSVSDNVKVYYTVGGKASARIEAPVQVCGKVSVAQKGGKLVITAPDANINGKGSIKIFITAPAAGVITAQGNAEVNLRGNYSASGLKLTATGNGEIEADYINCADLECKASGNGEIEIERGLAAQKINLTASGNGEVSAENVLADRIVSTASGNAEISCKQVSVSELKSTVSGNSQTKLSGKSGTVCYVAGGNAHITAENLHANGGTALAGGNSNIKAAVYGLQIDKADQGRVYNDPR